MFGAIAGDVIGSAYEFRPTKAEDFVLFPEGATFTDDTVLTVATAEALLAGGDYAAAYRAWARRYPDAGYGSLFRQWCRASDPAPYGSWGNGSAMRVSPVGWAIGTLEEVLTEAAKSAAVTHHHPEGVRGAQAVAGCVFLARTGATRADLRAFVEGPIGYPLARTLAQIRPAYCFDESCRGSVPEALTAFLESADWEDAVRKAVSLGGDADTQAAIAGAVAEAFYGGVPGAIQEGVFRRLTGPVVAVVKRFRERFGGGRESGGGDSVSGERTSNRCLATRSKFPPPIGAGPWTEQRRKGNVKRVRLAPNPLICVVEPIGIEPTTS